MTRYRLRAFKPGPGPEPELWQTHDVFAENDDDAKAKAGALFQQLLTEANYRLVNFSLSEGGRLVYMSPRRDWVRG